MKLTAAESLEEAVEGADVVIGATSASTPYLLPEHLKTVSLYSTSLAFGNTCSTA